MGSTQAAESKDMIYNNIIAGSGKHTHEVPSSDRVVIDFGRHSIWRSRDAGNRSFWVFVDTIDETVRQQFRCILVRGLRPENVPESMSIAIDKGFTLIGTSRLDDLAWLPRRARVLWDSKDSELVTVIEAESAMSGETLPWRQPEPRDGEKLPRHASDNWPKRSAKRGAR